MVLSLVLVTSVLGASKLRGFISLFLGLTIGLVGMDLNTGQPRLTFDQPAAGRPASTSWWSRSASSRSARRSGWPRTCGARRSRSSRSASRGWAATTGAAPGSRGCAAPRSASRSAPYRPAAPRPRRSCPTSPSGELARKHEEFGKGAIEGVAGPEAANNASAAGSFVPLLALGLPTTATAAIMLAALQSYGIQPGPQLMTEQADLVWTLLAAC